MSTNKILLKFAKKGINLSPEAYEKVINAENPVNFSSNIIVKLKGDKFSSKDLVSVSGETIDEICGISKKKDDVNQKTLIEADEKEETKTPQPNENIKKESDIKEKGAEDIKTPKSIESFKKDSDVKEKHINKEIEEASETVTDTKVKFKRNLEKTEISLLHFDFVSDIIAGST